jgi:hypothetical protein
MKLVAVVTENAFDCGLDDFGCCAELRPDINVFNVTRRKLPPRPLPTDERLSGSAVLTTPLVQASFPTGISDGLSEVSVLGFRWSDCGKQRKQSVSGPGFAR